MVISSILIKDIHPIHSHNHPDPRNPLYDVFYLYYNYDIKRAKRLLKKQFNNPKLKNHAYINYGVIKEYEKDYKQAEKHYKLALNNGEKCALIYLLNLYKKLDSVKYIKLLNSIKIPKQDYWIDYEKAVFYLEQGNIRKAIKLLWIAVDKGFNSINLLLRDPAFDQLRGSKSFSKIITKIKNSNYKKKSLLEELHDAEYEYSINKPFGMSRDLEYISRLEKRGKDKKAEKALLSLLKSNILYRERSIALFWLARIKAKNGERGAAKKYLKKFIKHIRNDQSDNTGYKRLIRHIYKDIILNDIYLKEL